MRHFLYPMRSTDPAPAGDGDTKSWFEFYKWNTDEETYVPKKFPFMGAEEGDYIWFVMDSLLLGGAKLLRVETPPLPVQIQELWYNAGEIHEFTPQRRPLGWTGFNQGVVPEEVARIWLEESEKRK